MRKIVAIRVIVLTLALALVVPVSIAAAPEAGPVPAPPRLDPEAIEDALKTVARWGLGIGILMFGVSLILPGDFFSILGFQIPQNYLTRAAMGAIIIGASAMIVEFLLPG